MVHSLRTFDAKATHAYAVAPTRDRVVGVFSPGIARIPGLAAMIGARRIVFGPRVRIGPTVDVVVGWGRKANTARPSSFAKKRGIPFVRLEDGWLRSVGLGVEGEPPLSVVIDDVGMYYDATAPSRLEALLASRDGLLEDPALLSRARSCMERIRAARLSKYNNAPDGSPPVLAPSDAPRVLVVDQTAGDLSVRLGGVAGGRFDAMLDAALAENPDARIVVKTHPDVVAGKKRGCFSRIPSHPRIDFLTAHVNPHTVLQEVERVYVATSLLGFEALVAGKRVSTFGLPFYAGWGLTEDRQTSVRRTRVRSLEQVFAAAYLLYASYLDPERRAAAEAERVIDHLALQVDQGRRGAARIVCVGFSAWKRGFVPAFLRGPGVRVEFTRSAASLRRRHLTRGDTVVAWGGMVPPCVQALARAKGAAVWRLEDGFLRSVGLGVDLASPASLVVDKQGIYFDPAHPSDLEELLETSRFSSTEVDRAARLRRAIVEHGISKYNVGVTGRLELPAAAAGRAVALVVGQVENDASIRLGCPSLRRNQDLLAAVREARPGAYVIYKPHPDVASGSRAGKVSADTAARFADLVVADVGIGECLRVATELHTLTSLVGFEALLRELPVHTYGQPFYAGWGLTVDRHPHPRRTRRLTLDELVAGVLIRYPRYVSHVTGRYTTPEVALEELRAELARRGGAPRIGAGWAGRSTRKLANLWRGWLHAP